ncbi:hypothetical protein ACE1CD_15360 [Aerosakkonema sp. BLCC-F183]|uniref:hypothetical protein n=1 Tax=Aerosakkonema sp. BLCC-F183 TaxID=3342834 RepID=UPI0035BA2588
MNQRDKERVERANGNGHQKQQTRSATNAQKGAGNIQDKMIAARQKVKDTTKAFVVGGGISDALDDIANGDFGEFGDEVLTAFDNFIGEFEETHKSLKEAEISPKYSLPSSPFQTLETEAAAIN